MTDLDGIIVTKAGSSRQLPVDSLAITQVKHILFNRSNTDTKQSQTESCATTQNIAQ